MKLAQRIHRLRFFVADAWDEWRHNPGINLLAVATLATTLFLAGLLLLLLANIEAQVKSLRDDVRIEIYLEDDTSVEQRAQLQRQLESFEGVRRVEFIDKQQAVARYREFAGEMAELVDEMQANPLPASFELYLESRPDVEALGRQIGERLSRKPMIEEVRFDIAWLGRLESLIGVARAGAGAIVAVVLIAVVFVMASVVRLAVLSRREEIEIMQLVGATPGFVRGPFLMAGVGQGLAAAAAALALVELVRRLLIAQAADGGSLALLELVASRPLPWGLCGLVVVVGLLVSLAGSYFAVRRAV